MRIIITGGNSGIGKATAAALAAAGHSVVIACRTLPKAEQAAAEMAGDVEVRHLDLADLTSVRRFADSVESVDVLVEFVLTGGGHDVAAGFVHDVLDHFEVG